MKALGWFSRRIAVWTSVEAPFRVKPVLDVDAEGFNAHLLPLLAGRHLPPWKRVEEVWVASWVCTALVVLPFAMLMPKDSASQFPPVLLLSLIGSGVLAWMTFRDRWKVIEAFSSRYCSGLVNFSLLYVPLVAWGYANVRAVRKLSGK